MTRLSCASSTHESPQYSQHTKWEVVAFPWLNPLTASTFDLDTTQSNVRETHKSKTEMNSPPVLRSSLTLSSLIAPPPNRGLIVASHCVFECTLPGEKHSLHSKILTLSRQQRKGQRCVRFLLAIGSPFLLLIKKSFLLKSITEIILMRVQEAEWKRKREEKKSTHRIFCRQIVLVQNSPWCKNKHSWRCYVPWQFIALTLIGYRWERIIKFEFGWWKIMFSTHPRTAWIPITIPFSTSSI